MCGNVASGEITFLDLRCIWLVVAQTRLESIKLYISILLSRVYFYALLVFVETSYILVSFLLMKSPD